MGHTDAPHIVEVLHANWVELLVATAHFIHVHTVDIALHANWKVDLWLVRVWLRIRVDKSMKPTDTCIKTTQSHYQQPKKIENT